MDYEEFRRQVEARKVGQDALGPKGRGRQPSLIVEPEATAAERLRQLLPVAKALVAGALNNMDIQAYFAEYPGTWTPEGQKRHPTVRVEYEHTLVISGIGEGLSIGKGKNWGLIVGVFPLEPADPVHPSRVLYLFKDSNPYQRRFDQRRYMRERLRAGRLVTLALRSRLGAFVPMLTAADVVLIKDRLGLDPREFWRAAKGRAVLAIPTQRSLLDRAIED